MGSGAVALPSDDEFNRVSFLSHFDGANNGVNNAFDDGSASNHTVTAAGNVTQGSFGPFARPDGEWGVRFPENHPHYFDIASSSDFAIGANADYTFELFVFYNSKDSNHIFMDYRTAGSNGTFPIFSIQGDETYNFQDNTSNTGKIAYSFDQGVASLKSATKLTLNTWNHVAIVRNSGTINIYINGTRDNNSSTNNTTVATQAAIRFGDLALNSVGTADSATEGTTEDGTRSHYPDLQFSGVLSNFRFVNGTAVYSGSSITVPTSKLTAITNTKLLLFQSNRFVDNSASGHTVPVTAGSPAVTSFGPFLSSAVYDPAVNGASAYMDGSGDTLRVVYTAADIVNQNFTLEYWLYYTQTSGYGSVSISGSSGGGNASGDDGLAHLSFLSTNGQVFTDDGQNSGSGPDTGAGGINGNSWNHLALVRVSDDMFIYINGVKAATKSLNTALFDEQSVELGVGVLNKILGYVTDVRLVTSAVYTGNTYTVPTAPLTAITNTKVLLNMADGQVIDSASHNNVTLYGTAKTSTAQKLFGSASFLLDGNSDYATILSEVGIFGGAARGGKVGNFTIEFSFRLAADVGSTPFVAIAKWETSGDQRSWMVRLDSVSSANKMKFYESVDGDDFTATTFSASFSSETWYKIAIVNVSGTVSLYVNGTADSTTRTLETGAPFPTTSLVTIGANVPSNPQQYFNGNIDDVRLSKFARYTGNYTAQSEAFPDKGQ